MRVAPQEVGYWGQCSTGFADGARQSGTACNVLATLEGFASMPTGKTLAACLNGGGDDMPATIVGWQYAVRGSAFRTRGSGGDSLRLVFADDAIDGGLGLPDRMRLFIVFSGNHGSVSAARRMIGGVNHFAQKQAQCGMALFRFSMDLLIQRFTARGVIVLVEDFSAKRFGPVVQRLYCQLRELCDSEFH